MRPSPLHLRGRGSPSADAVFAHSCCPRPLSTGYQPLTFNIKPHARIIWDVAFSPLFPTATAAADMVFVTGSRDKTAKVWRRPAVANCSAWEAVRTLRFDEGVTSVDFYGALVDARCVALASRSGACWTSRR